MAVFAADSGLVLKAIHLPREHGQSQEVTLEQLQVFQVQQTVSHTVFNHKSDHKSPFVFITAIHYARHTACQADRTVFS